MSGPIKCNDDTVMWFGAHRGKKLGDLEDRYFEWLWDQTWLKEHPGLFEYTRLLMACKEKEKCT